MIEYINETCCRIQKAEIDRFVGFLYNYFNISHRLLLEIVFLDSVAMKKINNAFRKKNKATDVLSFPIQKSNGALGTIVLCPKIIKKQENKYCFLPYIAHGFLHLMGYDHDTNPDEKKWQKTIDLINFNYDRYKKISK